MKYQKLTLSFNHTSGSQKPLLVKGYLTQLVEVFQHRTTY